MGRDLQAQPPGGRPLLDHARVERLLSHYRDLTPDEQTQVQEHLAACARCRRQLAAFEQMDQRLGQSAGHLPERRLKDGFYAALDAARSKRRPFWGGNGSDIRRWAVQALSLALLVGMIAGLSLLIRRQVPDLAATPVGTSTQTGILPPTSLPEIKPIPQRLTLTEPGRAEMLTLSEDGQFLAAAQGSRVQIWATASGRLLETLDIGADPAVEMAFTPNDLTLVVRTSAGRLQRWRVAGGARLTDGETAPVVAPGLPFAADNTHLALATADHRVELWEMDTGRYKKTIIEHDEALTDLSFSAGGGLLLVGDHAGTVHVWDLSTSTDIQLTGLQGPVLALVINPRGDQIAASFAGGQVRLWSHSDGTILQTLPAGQAELLDMQFANGGDTFLRLLQDGSLEHWPVGKGQPHSTQTVPALRSGAFALLSRGLVLAGVTMDGQVALWEKVE